MDIIQFWLDNHKSEESIKQEPNQNENGESFFVDREGDKSKKRKENGITEEVG